MKVLRRFLFVADKKLHDRCIFLTYLLMNETERMLTDGSMHGRYQHGNSTVVVDFLITANMKT